MTSTRSFRVGQIVPSSNTTMETEIPAMLRMREAVLPERFTFHSSRMRMKHVVKEELEAMDRDSDRCAIELSDARVDVLGYACLVAIMSMGHGYHRISEARLHQRTQENNAPAPVVTSAGALIEGLHRLGAKTVSVICPYMKPLTKLVVDYIESEGITVRDYTALEIPDNLKVGRHDPQRLLDIYKTVDRTGIDAFVASACVQMPSLPIIQPLQDEIGIPVVSAAICTTHQMHDRLGIARMVPSAGALLDGSYRSTGWLALHWAMRTLGARDAYKLLGSCIVPPPHCLGQPRADARHLCGRGRRSPERHADRSFGINTHHDQHLVQCQRRAADERDGRRILLATAHWKHRKDLAERESAEHAPKMLGLPLL